MPAFSEYINVLNLHITSNTHHGLTDLQCAENNAIEEVLPKHLYEVVVKVKVLQVAQTQNTERFWAQCLNSTILQ